MAKIKEIKQNANIYQPNSLFLSMMKQIKPIVRILNLDARALEWQCEIQYVKLMNTS